MRTIEKDKAVIMVHDKQKAQRLVDLALAGSPKLNTIEKFKRALGKNFICMTEFKM